MIQSSKVLWGEGLFLRPQHFQRQDAYHEWRLAQMARALHPYAWGVRKATIDAGSLAGGVLRFTELQITFADGEMYSAPHDDELPAAVALDGPNAYAGDVIFHAALAPLQPNGGNAQGSDPGHEDTGRRYVQHDQEAADWFTNAAPAPVALLRRRLRVKGSAEALADQVHLPLCRLNRSSTGQFEIDSDFIPPVACIAAAPSLWLLARRLLDVLLAKVNALYGLHRQPSEHIIEFRSGDIASFWLLHTASTAHAAISHLYDHGQLHPERLYQELLRLAGALMTFSKHQSLDDLPKYVHSAPQACFQALDSIIRRLLETVISTRCFSIALSEAKPSFHQGRLDSGSITAATTFYLGVQCALPPSELVETVPLQFKVGAPDDVEKVVLTALPGIKTTHAPQVPAAVPVRPGMYYFEIESRGLLYERMLKSQTIIIYTPTGLPELHLELLALNP